MQLSYDAFVEVFLAKITEYSFLQLPTKDREVLVDGYLFRSISSFRHICKYDLAGHSDKVLRLFAVEVADEDVGEILEIVSEGMVVQWLKGYVYRQELLENVLNTRDFTSYSPAELLYRVQTLYEATKKHHTQLMREYSYNHNDLSNLHL